MENQIVNLGTVAQAAGGTTRLNTMAVAITINLLLKVNK
jgi:hypothetical protein